MKQHPPLPGWVSFLSDLVQGVCTPVLDIDPNDTLLRVIQTHTLDDRNDLVLSGATLGPARFAGVLISVQILSFLIILVLQVLGQTSELQHICFLPVFIAV